MQIPVREPGQKEGWRIIFTPALQKVADLSIQLVYIGAFFYDHIGAGIAVGPFLKAVPSFQCEVKIEDQVELFCRIRRVMFKEACYDQIPGEFTLLELYRFSDHIR